MARFLCDNCRYDHPNACSNPERPNATKCADYKSSGSAGGYGPASEKKQWTLGKIIFLIIAILIIISFVFSLFLPFF